MPRPPRAQQWPRKRCTGQRALLWALPGCEDLARLRWTRQAAVDAAGCSDHGRLRCPAPEPMSLRSRRSRALGAEPSTQPQAQADSRMASVSLELIAVAGMHRSRGAHPRGPGPISAQPRSKPTTTALNSGADGDYPKSNRLLCTRVDNGRPVGLDSAQLTPGGVWSNGELRLL